ncbi:MAG: hypothetical protein PHC97_00485 [Patescibacteria group bacterium]|nr:hypothetical protein [Patescibacteria group bacterium]
MEKEKKEIIAVNPKPITEKTEQTKPGGVTIKKVGNLTFNIFTDKIRKRYQKHYLSDKTHLIIDGIFALIIILLLGSLVNLWLFSRTKLINLMDFKVSSVPEILINGQNAQFQINFTNTTGDELKEAVLILKLPDSLKNPQFDSANFDLKTHSLKIGDISGHGSGELKVSGLLLGNLGSKQEFLAVINYKNKYGQDRQEFFSQTLWLTQSVIETKITLPAKITATSPFEGDIFVKNNADSNFKDFKLKLIGPTGFRLIKPDLNDQSDLSWAINPTTQGENFKFNGKTYAEKPQPLNLRDEIYATYQGQEYLLAEGTASAPVEFSKFILDFSNPEKNAFAKPGDTITYNVHYKNTENFTLNNVVLGLELSGDYADSTSLKNKSVGSIAPGQEGMLEISTGLKPTINFSTFNESGYNIEARIVASFDQEGAATSLESLPLVTKLSSRLSLDTDTLFFTSEGDQIGVGSVPPKVGEYTSYWAVIKVTNTNNKVQNVKVFAQIPDGVEFTKIYNVTAGNQIIYNKETNQLEWQIEEIPALAGLYNPAPEARIQLAITPTSDQVGTSPLLLSNISASGTDEVTGYLLTAVGASVSTIISSDPTLNEVIQ